MFDIDKCKVCGSKTEPHRSGAFTCDECGASICERCWGTLTATHVKEPTKQGLVGFVKLCPDCQKKHKNSTTKTYLD